MKIKKPPLKQLLASLLAQAQAENARLAERLADEYRNGVEATAP